MMSIPCVFIKLGNNSCYKGGILTTDHGERNIIYHFFSKRQKEEPHIFDNHCNLIYQKIKYPDKTCLIITVIYRDLLLITQCVLRKTSRSRFNTLFERQGPRTVKIHCLLKYTTFETGSWYTDPRNHLHFTRRH